MNNKLQLTIANIFGDGFTNEVFVEVYVFDISREYIDLDIDEQAIRQHHLKGFLVAPLAKNDFLRLQLIFKLFQRRFQLSWMFVAGRPYETSLLCIILLCLVILVGC